jgi:hypothetical protein
MKAKDIISVLIPLFVLFIAHSSPGNEATGKHRLTIIYTNDVQGEIEPCG